MKNETFGKIAAANRLFKGKQIVEVGTNCRFRMYKSGAVWAYPSDANRYKHSDSVAMFRRRVKRGETFKEV